MRNIYKAQIWIIKEQGKNNDQERKFANFFGTRYVGDTSYRTIDSYEPYKTIYLVERTNPLGGKSEQTLIDTEVRTGLQIPFISMELTEEEKLKDCKKESSSVFIKEWEKNSYGIIGNYGGSTTNISEYDDDWPARVYGAVLINDNVEELELFEKYMEETSTEKLQSELDKIKSIVRERVAEYLNASELASLDAETKRMQLERKYNL